MANSGELALPHCRCTIMNQSSKNFFECVVWLQFVFAEIWAYYVHTYVCRQAVIVLTVLSGQPMFAAHTQCRLSKLIIWTKSIVSECHVIFAITSGSCRYSGHHGCPEYVVPASEMCQWDMALERVCVVCTQANDLNGQFNRQLNEQLQQATCHARQQPKNPPKPGTQIVTVTMSTTNKYYK